MTKEQIAIIKECVPILQKNGESLTKEFYRVLFETYPEVKPMLIRINKYLVSNQKL